MRFSTQVIDTNSAHVRFSLFANGANCGQLCMRVDEYEAFKNIFESPKEAPDAR